jgi:transposase
MTLPSLLMRFSGGEATRQTGTGATTDERERISALERENRELRQANEILRKASAYLV